MINLNYLNLYNNNRSKYKLKFNRVDKNGSILQIKLANSDLYSNRILFTPTCYFRNKYKFHYFNKNFCLNFEGKVGVYLKILILT